MLRLCSECSSGTGSRHWVKPERSRIKEAQITEMWAAYGHAVKIGKRFNWTLDVHFDVGGLFGLIPPLSPEPEVRKCLQRFLHSYRKWMAKRGAEAAYLWKLENAGRAFDEAHAKLHAHLLIYVPPALAKRFKQLQLQWWRKAGMQAAQLSRKEGDGKAVCLKSLRTIDQTSGKMKYVSKDIDESLRWTFKGEIDDRGKPSSKPINGQVYGASRNLSPKARREWQPPTGDTIRRILTSNTRKRTQWSLTHDAAVQAAA